MGYSAKELSTNKTYYSKGADKIANKIGINPRTITKHFQKSNLDKIIKGFIISKTIDLENKNRGNDIKSRILRA